MAGKPKKGLGRGLGSLLGEAAVESVKKEDIQGAIDPDYPGKGVTLVRLTDIEPNAGQPRQVFDDQSMQELADSIARNGVLQPLAVRRLPSGLFEIIAGERRWRASRMAGLREVPVIVLEADELHAMELAMVENLQREDLNPVEEANGYRTLLEKYGLTQEQVAERVGKSRPVIANAIRLLVLPEPVLNMLSAGKISAGHARALVPLESAEDQEGLAERIVLQGLTVRQVELAVKKILQGDPAEEDDRTLTVNYIEVLQENIGRRLGRRVKIVDGKKKGKIELEYYGQDDLNNLADLLSKLNRELT